MRVLDSFGTDAEFNYKYYEEDIPGGRSVWGNLNLLLPQFMTMYRKYIFSYEMICTVFSLKQRQGDCNIGNANCVFTTF